MSYYQQFPFNFSYHGLQRCRERLNMKENPEFEVKNEVIRLLKNSTKSFETKHDLYISAGNTEWYFVFKKQDKLLVTYTRVSATKQLDILMKDGYYN